MFFHLTFVFKFQETLAACVCSTSWLHCTANSVCSQQQASHKCLQFKIISFLLIFMMANRRMSDPDTSLTLRRSATTESQHGTALQWRTVFTMVIQCFFFPETNGYIQQSRQPVTAEFLVFGVFDDTHILHGSRHACVQHVAWRAVLWKVNVNKSAALVWR